MNDLKEIKEKLAAIESLLQRLPEIQAAVFLLMRDEYETAKAQGRDARQLYLIPIRGKSDTARRRSRIGLRHGQKKKIQL